MGGVRIIDADAVVPTRHRTEALAATLESLGQQRAQPRRVLVIDASDDDGTEEVCARAFDGLGSEVIHRRAGTRGAAAQRNQGVSLVHASVVFFFDDDVLFEPGCVELLWEALHADARHGGASAMITNGRFYPNPGSATRMLYRLLGAGGELPAGRCIGPAYNLLPSDDESLPHVVPVEWLNTTCTMYRREALPQPAFEPFFTGYSWGEDLALSLVVGRDWGLVNARTARIFHVRAPGDHKSDRAELARMALVNRWHIATSILGRSRAKATLQLALVEAFSILATARSQPRQLPAEIAGRVRGFRQILAKRGNSA